MKQSIRLFSPSQGALKIQRLSKNDPPRFLPRDPMNFEKDLPFTFDSSVSIESELCERKRYPIDRVIEFDSALRIDRVRLIRAKIPEEEMKVDRTLVGQEMYLEPKGDRSRFSAHEVRDPEWLSETIYREKWTFQQTMFLIFNIPTPLSLGITKDWIISNGLPWIRPSPCRKPTPVLCREKGLVRLTFSFPALPWVLRGCFSASVLKAFLPFLLTNVTVSLLFQRKPSKNVNPLLLFSAKIERVETLDEPRNGIIKETSNAERNGGRKPIE